MKRYPNYNIRQEKSQGNETIIKAYSGPAKLTMEHLESPRFQVDFEKAMQEKAVVRC